MYIIEKKASVSLQHIGCVLVSTLYGLGTELINQVAEHV